MLRLRGSERVIRKPDRFVYRLRLNQDYQNLSEDREPLSTSSGIRVGVLINQRYHTKPTKPRVVEGMAARVARETLLTTKTQTKPATKQELGHKLNTTDSEIEICKG